MTDDRLLAGIDAGTTRIRAIVFTPEGRPVAEGSRPTPVARPRPGWAEHDPEALWQRDLRARCATRAAQLDRPERASRGIAVASVGEAFVALDRHGRPTCPVIAWYDERPTRQLARLQTAIGHERLYALTGLSADPTFSLCKLLWLKDHQPEALGRAALCLNVAPYLAWRLCGVASADLSLASRTLALDLHRRRWAADLLREVGLAATLFADLRPCGERLGTVKADAAAATGLSTECVVGVAGHDHIMGALALGALAPGVLLELHGQRRGAHARARAVQPRPRARAARLQPGRGRGRAADPLRVRRLSDRRRGHRVVSRPARAEVAHEALITEAERVPPACHGVTFVPDLRGRISPVPDPLARGAWFGLGADTSRATLYRALLEGLAFEATPDRGRADRAARPAGRSRGAGDRRQHPEPTVDGDQGGGLRPRDRRRRDARGDRAWRGAARRPRGRSGAGS